MVVLVMSNLDGLNEPVATGSTAEGSAPTEGGQGETQATPEPSYLDTSQYGDHMVTLRVDGEDVTVPLSEALSGYSRTQDYTRKSQDVAEMRRQAEFGIALQQALENDPQATLQILQGRYQQPEPEPDDDWTADPNEVRIREMDARLARLDEHAANQELREAVGYLQQRYGEEFNGQEVVSRAFQQGRMDLENVYKEIAFDRYWQGQQAAAKQREAEEAQRTGAKAQASQTVHSGLGSNNAVAAPPPTSFATVEDAWLEAKRQLGVA